MTDKKQFFIVWNEGRNEGFITDSEEDAKAIKAGRFNGMYSSAGFEFHRCYEEDRLKVEKVEL